MPDEGFHSKNHGKVDFESKEIQYHSKSPEKLLEELKEKNRDRTSKYNKNRRTAFVLIAISGLLIAGVALFFVIYNNRSEYLPDYIKTVHPFVFKIVAASDNEYGSESEIKIRVSNIEKNQKSFSFKDFRFYISSENADRIFNFTFPIETTISMDAFDSRDVYDFRRENPNMTLKPGTYTIHARFVVDEKDIELVKEFNVFENVQTNLNLYNDYSLPSQEMPVYLTIVNNSPDGVNFLLGTYRVVLSPSENTLQDQILGSINENEEAMGEYEVLAGEKLDIKLGSLQAPAQEGIYQLKTSFFLNDDLYEDQQTLGVNNITKMNTIKTLRILPYTMKVIGVDQNYEAQILIANDEDRNIYERVKGFIFEIVKENATVYRYTKYDEQDINIFIPAYSKKVVFDSTQWRTIRFQEPGKYTMTVRIILENGVLEYSEECLVLQN